MGFYYDENIGTFHLNEAKAPRVVPTAQKHKWREKIRWGEQTVCLKCGCIKRLEKPDYVETYQMVGQEKVTKRPDCTGS